MTILLIVDDKGQKKYFALLFFCFFYLKATTMTHSMCLILTWVKKEKQWLTWSFLTQNKNKTKRNEIYVVLLLFPSFCDDNF